MTGGYSDPFYKTLNWDDAWDIPELNIYNEIDYQNLWPTLFFDHEFTSKLTLHLSGQHYDNTFSSGNFSLGTGSGGDLGSFLYNQEWQDEANSFIARLTWTETNLVANLGVEGSHSEMKQITDFGVFLEAPPGQKNPLFPKTDLVSLPTSPLPGASSPLLQAFAMIIIPTQKRPSAPLWGSPIC